jgi:hypothetical protein
MTQYFIAAAAAMAMPMRGYPRGRFLMLLAA